MDILWAHYLECCRAKPNAVSVHFTREHILRFGFAHHHQIKGLLHMSSRIQQNSTSHCESPTLQTRDIEPLLVQCWSNVVDGGPTLNQQWLNVSCLLGKQVSPMCFQALECPLRTVPSVGLLCYIVRLRHNSFVWLRTLFRKSKKEYVLI